ncbi:hypothetical protein E2C01_091859 [Portunus trituberculatus]|uniref:Uncharacterized protein n=1 Tax=Portunus trituberculatus TaxID=210409 RepID=A0A5B7JQ78_PORTR|nr:hypothetical protein [Portunus trituberculatus]
MTDYPMPPPPLPLSPSPPLTPYSISSNPHPLILRLPPPVFHLPLRSSVPCGPLTVDRPSVKPGGAEYTPSPII